MTSTSGQSDYGCSVNDLRNLMEYRGTKGKTKIQSDFGGTEGLCRRLKTDSVSGIPNTTEELKRRRAYFGVNEIPPHTPKGYFQLIWKALQNLPLFLLLVFASVSLVFLSFFEPYYDGTGGGGSDDVKYGVGWVECFAILISVVLYVLVTALSDYTMERRFRGLPSMIEMENKFSVIRGGTQIQVAVSELVVGDNVEIKNGDLVPADGILIASNDLKIDESPLTGESDQIKESPESGPMLQIKKSPDSDPMLLSGTRVAEGSGKMLVTAVGVNSQTGIITTLLGPKNAAVEVRKAAKRRAVFFYWLQFIVSTVLFIIRTYIIDGNSFSYSHFSNHLSYFLRISILLFAYTLPLALPIALVLIWRQHGWYAVRLRRFIQYQFTVKGVATFIAFITAIALGQLFV
uniref:Cation-transporting P-type ATPase N-terminal domain-containing protein n=1 Tax=Plectus sambesii TaxID=2011161 RepID=A0A914X9F5_9BILA